MGAKYDIVGGIVSDAAMKQLKELEKIANNIGGKLKGITLAGMSDKGEAAFIQKLNAETALLIKQEEKLQQTIAKGNAVKQAKVKLTQEEAVTQAALNNVSKLKAVLVSKETSDLQKLDAQIRLNVLSAQKYVAAGDTQNANYLKLIANTKQLSMEYDRMAKASGSNMVKTQSMYGATFQLTQVMRELPNFAIDARIGFMALSNNLPMLIDSFKNLSKEIDINTGKAYGNMGALKQFGKSLLSLNTIMIVASTLLVLYGEDIVDWVMGVDTANKALNEFNETLEKGNNIYTDGAKKIQDVENMIIAVNKGYTDGDKVLKIYNETLGDTFGKTDDLNTANKLILDNKEEYLNAIIAMASVQTIFTQALNDSSKALAMQREGLGIKGYFTTVMDIIGDSFKDESMGVGAFKWWGRWLNIPKEAKANFNNDIAELQESSKNGVKDYMSEINKLMDKYKDEPFFDKLFGITSKDTTNGSSGGNKTFTGIDAKKYFYDKQRGEILIRLKEIEDDVRKSNVEGDINSYDKRKSAALAFLDFTTKLAKMDAKVAKDAADEKKRIELKRAEDKHNKNIAKFGADSPLGKKSAEELAAATEIILENHALALAEIDDKLKVGLLAANIQYAGNIRSIHSDMYADDIYMLQQTEAQKQAILDASYEKQKANIQKRSLLQTLGDKLGIGGVSRFDEIAAESAYKGATRANKRATLTNKLNDPNASGEDKKQAERDLYALDLQSEQDYLAEKRAIEIENEQIVADAKTSIASDVIDTLKSLWDSYYQYQEDKIEKDLDKQTRINDERIKQYEDETEAGLHTAKELSDFKERATVYQQSVEEEAARKKEELQKKQFLTEQAFAIGQVWINYAINVAKAGVDAIAQAWLLGSAIASTALITAQSIPAFEQGGVVAKDGTILAGEKRHELAILPDGSFFVTANKPTLYDVPKGTEIMPDLNKIDIMDILHLKPLYANHSEDKQLIREMQNVTRAIKTQKQGNFYGMPLIKQLDSRGRFDSRRKSLMN